MCNTAKFVKEIVIQDPDSGGRVGMTVYKHPNGGLFAIDSSFLDQVADEDSEGNAIIKDPFGDHNLLTLKG